MNYRVTLGSNPRMLLLGLVLLVLPAAGVLLLVFVGTFIGLAVLAGALYLDWTMIRYLYRNLRSRVETSDDRISCRLPEGEELVFPWKAVTIAGYCRQPRRRPFLFVYDEKMDKIVTIPDEYSQFEDLKAEVRRRVPAGVFHELALEVGETIQERLRPLVRPGPGGHPEA